MSTLKYVATMLVCTSLYSSLSFAAPQSANPNQAEMNALKAEYEKSLEAAAKSTDVQAGLVKACAVTYKKAVTSKILTQADVNKLCGCSVEAEGAVTVADQWAVQSAVNSKDKKKVEQIQITMMKKHSASVKACVGEALGKKLTDLLQANAPAPQSIAPTPKK